MAVKRWIVFLIVGFLSTAQRTQADDIKIWRANTNFENVQNWDVGRLPCSNDRIIFPPLASVTVFMPQSFAVAEMVLPLNGELIFPKNAAFDLTGGSQTGQCRGQDVHFKQRVDAWFDPENWNLTSDRAFPRIPSVRNEAVPHAYQVPCVTDRVVFPTGNTFQVQEINPTPNIAALFINDMEYSEADFKTLLNTPTGKLLFPDSPRISVSRASCAEKSGCMCGNEEPTILSTICKFKTPCPDINCLDPIEVVGHCCPICATKLFVKYNNRFRMETLTDHLQILHNQEAFSSVKSFTARITADTIQSVFVDGTHGNNIANSMVQLFYKKFSQDSEIYGMLSIEIKASKSWTDHAVPAYYSSSGLSTGGTAGIIVLFILMAGLAAAFYVYRKRQIQGFSFARFDLRADKIELELDTTPHDELDPVDSPTVAPAEDTSRGFDNPGYGTCVTSETLTDVPEESLGVTEDFVENPMFRIFEDSSKRDDNS